MANSILALVKNLKQCRSEIWTSKLTLPWNQTPWKYVKTCSKGESNVSNVILKNYSLYKCYTATSRHWAQLGLPTRNNFCNCPLLGHDIQLQATLHFLHWRCTGDTRFWHFGKVWSDHSIHFCSLYYWFILCFMWFVFVPLSPANHEQKLINVVFSLIFIIVKLSIYSLRPGTSMALPVSSRPSPSISPSSWRFSCISFHCCLDSTAFVRRISGMAPERFKSPRPKWSYPMLSHTIPNHGFVSVHSDWIMWFCWFP